MRRSQFIEKYKIGSEASLSPLRNLVSIRELTRITGDFLSSKFGGLFCIDPPVNTREYVHLCFDHFVNLFKLLAVDVHAKSLIYVNFSCNKLKFVVNISVKGGLPIEEDELRELILCARNAGFYTDETENGLVLTKEVATVADMSVFTRIFTRKTSLEKRFAEIFFGE
jgi:hypothetical protein